MTINWIEYVGHGPRGGAHNTFYSWGVEDAKGMAFGILPNGAPPLFYEDVVPNMDEIIKVAMMRGDDSYEKGLREGIETYLPSRNPNEAVLNIMSLAQASAEIERKAEGGEYDHIDAIASKYELPDMQEAIKQLERKHLSINDDWEHYYIDLALCIIRIGIDRKMRGKV